MKHLSRSREGAWIEISLNIYNNNDTAVAPVRERGLKYCYKDDDGRYDSRSREGAWIEI